MADTDKQSAEQSKVNEMWRAYVTGEDPSFNRRRRVLSLIPSSPRCKVCSAPFSGLGSVLMRGIGRSRAKMNPNLCNMCEDFAQSNHAGAEIPMSLLFADIRGSTQLAEKMGTARFSALIARFYDAVTHELVKSDALIDRLIGDEVIALFIPAVAGPGGKHAEAALRAAQGVLRATDHDKPGGPWVPLGVGIHTGSAFFGAVGSGGVSDITALGDDVNLTARLASVARPGEILITEATRAASGLAKEGLESRRLELKGRSAPVDVWLMRIGAPAADANLTSA